MCFICIFSKWFISCYCWCRKNSSQKKKYIIKPHFSICFWPYRVVAINQPKHPSSNNNSSSSISSSSSSSSSHPRPLQPFSPAPTRAAGSLGLCQPRHDRGSTASSICSDSGFLMPLWSTVNSTAASAETPAWPVRIYTLPNCVFIYAWAGGCSAAIH